MEITGSNLNNNSARSGINNKIYSPFLYAPSDKVEITGQNSSKSDQTEDKSLHEEVKDVIDPKKNYKRLSVKIAGTAGAGVLLGGLALLTIFKGKSGFFNEKLGNYVQKLRGQAFSLQNETSLRAKINYHFKTGIVKLFDNGLNSWVNFDQLKNTYIDQKIIKKTPLRSPFEWVCNKFKYYAQKNSLNKYNQSVKEAKKLESLSADLKNAIKQAGMDDIKDKNKIRQLIKDYGLEINENSSRTEVIDAIIKKIVENTENLAKKENFDNRQKQVEEVLQEHILNPYLEEFKMLSKDKNLTSFNGIKESIYEVTDDAKKLTKSSEGIISRRNQEVRNFHKDAVYKEKELISRTIEDNCKEASTLIQEAENNLMAIAKNDQKLLALYTSKYKSDLRYIEEAMKSYKNARTSAGKLAREQNKQIFEKYIETLKTELKENHGNKADDIINVLDKAKNRVVESDKKGLLEELREIMKCSDNNACNSIKMDNQDLYNKFKRTTAAFSNKLNKAVNFETDNLFFRQMDLKLGGGNFEIFGFSVPVALGAYNVLKTDDHEERVSKGIRTGSVIGGGLLGWFTSGVVLCLSAGNALVLSLGAGIVADKIGKFIDNKFWSKGKDWDAINKQKKLEAKAFKAQNK